MINDLYNIWYTRIYSCQGGANKVVIFGNVWCFMSLILMKIIPDISSLGSSLTHPPVKHQSGHKVRLQKPRTMPENSQHCLIRWLSLWIVRKKRWWFCIFADSNHQGWSPSTLTVPFSIFIGTSHWPIKSVTQYQEMFFIYFLLFDIKPVTDEFGFRSNSTSVNRLHYQTDVSKPKFHVKSPWI